MQAGTKLLEAIQQGNPHGTCPICHSPMPPGSMNRLAVALELAYQSGYGHGRAKARWLDLLSGSAIASLVWAAIWLLAVRL